MNSNIYQIYIMLLTIGMSISVFGQNSATSVFNEYRSQIELPRYYKGEFINRESPYNIDIISESRGILTIKYHYNGIWAGEANIEPITVLVDLRNVTLEYSSCGGYTVYFNSPKWEIEILRSTDEPMHCCAWCIETKSAIIARHLYDELNAYWGRFNPSTQKPPKANVKNKSSNKVKINKKDNSGHINQRKSKSGKYGQ